MSGPPVAARHRDKGRVARPLYVCSTFHFALREGERPSDPRPFPSFPRHGRTCRAACLARGRARASRTCRRTRCGRRRRGAHELQQRAHVQLQPALVSFIPSPRRLAATWFRVAHRLPDDLYMGSSTTRRRTAATTSAVARKRASLGQSRRRPTGAWRAARGARTRTSVLLAAHAIPNARSETRLLADGRRVPLHSTYSLATERERVAVVLRQQDIPEHGRDSAPSPRVLRSRRFTSLMVCRSLK